MATRDTQVKVSNGDQLDDGYFNSLPKLYGVGTATVSNASSNEVTIAKTYSITPYHNFLIVHVDGSLNNESNDATGSIYVATTGTASLFTQNLILPSAGETEEVGIHADFILTGGLNYTVDAATTINICMYKTLANPALGTISVYRSHVVGMN